MDAKSFAIQTIVFEQTSILVHVLLTLLLRMVLGKSSPKSSITCTGSYSRLFKSCQLRSELARKQSINEHGPSQGKYNKNVAKHGAKPLCSRVFSWKALIFKLQPAQKRDKHVRIHKKGNNSIPLEAVELSVQLAQKKFWSSVSPFTEQPLGTFLDALLQNKDQRQDQQIKKHGPYVIDNLHESITDHFKLVAEGAIFDPRQTENHFVEPLGVKQIKRQ